MLIKPEISARIKLLRFPLIVGVVLIHTQIKQYSSYPISDWVQSFLEIISREAVPLLFIISGYLFFINFEFTWNNYIKKVKSRFWTILVPYLFWNFTSLVLLLSLQLIPKMSSFFIRDNRRFLVTDQTNFIDYLFGAFGIYNYFPASGYLWYLRDLFLMVLLTPLLWFLVKKIPYLTLIVLTLNWMGNLHIVGYSVSLMFFYLGALLAVKNVNLLMVDKYNKFIIIIYLVMAVFVVNGYTIYPNKIINININIVFTQLTVLLGILAIWSGSNLLSKPIENILLKLSPFAVFVFLAQQPFILAGKFLFVNKFLPRSNFLLVLISFVFISLFVIIGTLATGLTLKRYTPNFYNFITGNRG